jgi:D-aminoacyl-tRNA deacylase
MKAVLQRVSEASVIVEGEVVGQIGTGVLALVGAARNTGPEGDAPDTEADADWLADRIAGLRIFEDDAGKMNLSVTDAAGAVLVVSQFTLLADAARGRRPSFTGALAPELARVLVDRVADQLRARGLTVATGRFGADMRVSLVNDGPVTILLDSRVRN